MRKGGEDLKNFLSAVVQGSVVRVGVLRRSCAASLFFQPLRLLMCYSGALQCAAVQRGYGSGYSAWVWGPYIPEWNKLLCLGGLRSPCDGFSCNSLNLKTDVGKSCVDWCPSWRFKHFYLPIGAVLASCGAAQSLYKARYLVDPASSHMLVSKIKPCMSKYKPV